MRSEISYFTGVLDFPPSAVNAMRTCLKINIGLEYLILHSESVFSEDFSSEIRFNLRNLQTGFGGNQIQRRNLNSFLKTQRNSLKSLVIINWMGIDVFKTVLSMPGLTHLFLVANDLAEPEFLVENFKENNSVVSLQLWLDFSIDDEAVSKFKTFLKAFPKVQSLKILNMDNNIADFISETCVFLKKLSVEFFMASKVADESFFFNLESLESKVVFCGASDLFEKLQDKPNPKRRRLC